MLKTRERYAHCPGSNRIIRKPRAEIYARETCPECRKEVRVYARLEKTACYADHVGRVRLPVVAAVDQAQLPLEGIQPC